MTPRNQAAIPALIRDAKAELGHVQGDRTR
jgi:hypothetical protein